MQRAIVGLGLDLLEGAAAPRTTVQAPFRWAADDAWRAVYARVDPERTEALRSAGERRRKSQRRARGGR
jgi:hypothetical protein